MNSLISEEYDALYIALYIACCATFIVMWDGCLSDSYKLLAGFVCVLTSVRIVVCWLISVILLFPRHTWATGSEPMTKRRRKFNL